MKITHYICPRRCGKTTKAQEMQKDDPSKILIVRGENGSLFDMKYILQTMKGQHGGYSGVIIDDYIDVANTKNFDFQEFVIEMSYFGVEEMILFSTPDKLYTKEELFLASLDIPSRSFNSFNLFNPQEVWDKIKEINNKCLNPSKVNIVKTDFGKKHSDSFIFARINDLPRDIFATEIKGEFIKQ